MAQGWATWLKCGCGLAVLGLAVACGGDDEGGPAEGPPEEELFVEVLEYCDWSTVDPQTGVPTSGMCPRFYFDEQTLMEWCIVPDADSFDDYIEYREDESGNTIIDPQTKMPIVLVPRGKTPIPIAVEVCPADGVKTGPDGDEYYPSKFCRVPNCDFTVD